jgi:hypothetical protein
MTLRLNGSTSGYTEIDAPAVAGSNTLVLPTGNGSSGQVLSTNGSGALSWRNAKAVQLVSTSTGAYGSGTTTVPLDDTIPQNTEGTEFMTLAMTPTDSSNKLVIQVLAQHTSETTDRFITGALFQDSTANALAASTFYCVTATATGIIYIQHIMTAGTTSSTTFKYRAGLNNTGTTSFNGRGGGRFMGGVSNSSITIFEVQP